MTFRVGQKVVCVDDSPSFLNGKPCPLRKRSVYEIRDMYRTPDDEVLHLQVAGFNPHFHHRRFRPIVDKKTDIGFAHEILRKASRTRETAG